MKIYNSRNFKVLHDNVFMITATTIYNSRNFKVLHDFTGLIKYIKSTTVEISRFFMTKLSTNRPSDLQQ